MVAVTPVPASGLLWLYGTSACHLCEEAIAVLQAMPTLAGWELEWIDIAAEEALVARYGLRIPVLARPELEVELDWPFDTAAVLALVSLPSATHPTSSGQRGDVAE